MRKLLYLTLVVGFLFVDFLYFHDFFKPGETITLAQYLTGALSVLVFAVSIRSLVQPEHK